MYARGVMVTVIGNGQTEFKSWTIFFAFHRVLKINRVKHILIITFTAVSLSQ